MNDREGFLSRWARRKRQAAEPGHEGPETDAAPDSGTSGISPQEAKQAEAKSAATVPPDKAEGAAERKETDTESIVSRLPSIESITAGTDIRPFLAPGVPVALRNAALRRAWLVDPMRDSYITPVDFDWDFNSAGFPGFDFSPPTDKMREYVKQLWPSQSPKKDSESTSSDAIAGAPAHENVRKAKSSVAESSRPELPKSASEPVRIGSDSNSDHTIADDRAQQVIAEHSKADAAPHQNDAPQQENDRPVKRGHGSAIPR